MTNFVRFTVTMNTNDFNVFSSLGLVSGWSAGGLRLSGNHYSVTDIFFAQFIVTLVLGGMAFVLQSFLLAKCATIQIKPPVYVVKTNPLSGPTP